MSSVFGKIKSINGFFNIKSDDGSERKASIYDELYDKDIVIGSNENNAKDNLVVALKDGTELVVHGQEKQLLDRSLLAQELTEEETVTQKDSFLALLKENNNIEDLETAAGENTAVDSTESPEAVFLETNYTLSSINTDLRERSFQDDLLDSSIDINEDIRRTDVNEAISLTVTPIATLTEESVTAGTTVATSVASDEDGGVIVFSISDTTNYVIDSATGEVTLTTQGAAIVNGGADLPNFTVTATSSNSNASQEVNPANTTPVNDAPTITFTSVNNFIEDAPSNAVGSVVATYTTYDAEGSSVSVTLSDTINYVLGTGTDAGKVLLTAEGLALVNAGTDLPAFTLTPNDGTINGTAATVDPVVQQLFTITTTSSSVAEGGLITGFMQFDFTPHYAEWTIDLSNTSATSVSLDLDNGSINGSLWNFLENAEFGDFSGLEYKNADGNWVSVDTNFLNPTAGTVTVASADTSLAIRTKITPDLMKEADEIFHLHVTIDGVTKSSEMIIQNDDSNSAPVANNDIYTVNEDTALILNLLANDLDLDSNMIYTDTIAVKSINGTDITGSAQTILVPNGTVLVDVNGVLTFKPDLNYSGSVSFPYIITDGVLESNATVDITVNSVADAIPAEDVSIVVGVNTPLIIDTNSLPILDGKTSYTYANGITASSLNGTFSYSSGSLLGIGSPKSSGGAGIAGNEAIVFSFPTGIQSITMKLKNAANDTVMLSNDLDLTHLSNSISGTVTPTGGTFTDTTMNVKLIYTDSTGSHTVIGTVTNGGNWTVSFPSELNLSSVTNAKIVTILDGDLFNQGGNADAFVTFSVDTDMKNLSIAQDATNTYSATQLNDGFQIEYISVNPTSNGATIYNYSIDIYAKIQDFVGTPETFSALKLSDFPNPSESTISVVFSDGSYAEISANSSGEYDLTAYTTLLNTATGDTFVDKIYLTTSTPVDSGFIPTMTIGTQDGSSVAYSIIGGTASSTLTGGDGNDYISSGSGNDTLNGGAGNDSLVLDTADTLVDGGADYDKLLVDTSIDFGGLNDSLIQNIEEIDLGNGTAQNITLALSDVLAMTDADNDLFITGDSTDSVALQDATWTKSATQSQAGFDEYSSQDGTVKLQIQDDLTVSHS